MNTLKRASAQGFTLVEVLIVVVILGLIAAIAVPTFNSSTERAAAVKLIQAATDNINNATQALLVTTGDVANVTTGTSAIPDTGNSFLDVLVKGKDFVHADYQTDYEDAGVARLDRQIVTVTEPSAGTPGAYEVKGYALTYSSSADGQAEVVFAGVPSDIVERIKADREGEAFDATVADTTGSIQHDVAVSGKHNLTIVLVFN